MRSKASMVTRSSAGSKPLPAETPQAEKAGQGAGAALPLPYGNKTHSSARPSLRRKAGAVASKLFRARLARQTRAVVSNILRKEFIRLGRPVNLFFAVDISWSMREWANIVRAGREMSRYVGVYGMAVWAETAALANGVNTPFVGYGTDVASLASLQETWKEYDRLVIVTDGEFNDGLESCARFMSGIASDPPITWALTPFGTDAHILRRPQDDCLSIPIFGAVEQAHVISEAA